MFYPRLAMTRSGHTPPSSGPCTPIEQRPSTTTFLVLPRLPWRTVTNDKVHCRHPSRDAAGEPSRTRFTLPWLRSIAPPGADGCTSRTSHGARITALPPKRGRPCSLARLGCRAPQYCLQGYGPPLPPARVSTLAVGSGMPLLCLQKERALRDWRRKGGGRDSPLPPASGKASGPRWEALQ